MHRTTRFLRSWKIVERKREERESVLARVIIKRGNFEEESRERTHVCELTGWSSRDRNDSGESGRPSGKYIGP